MHRDLVRSLDGPEKMEGTAVVSWNREEYGKYLVPSETVVAYADGEEAVAWPLLLEQHDLGDVRGAEKTQNLMKNYLKTQ